MNNCTNAYKIYNLYDFKFITKNFIIVDKICQLHL